MVRTVVEVAFHTIIPFRFAVHPEMRWTEGVIALVRAIPNDVLFLARRHGELTGGVGMLPAKSTIVCCKSNTSGAGTSSFVYIRRAMIRSAAVITVIIIIVAIMIFIVVVQVR